MKILHVHTVPVISGSGINTLLTMVASVTRGHRVALACGSDGPLCDEARKSGIQIHIVHELKRELHILKDPISVVSLARLMRRQKFDLVHTHNSKAGFVGRLAAHIARVPLVIHTVHGFAFHEAESSARRLLFRMLERRAAAWCDGMIYVSAPLKEWAERERIGLNVKSTVIYSGIDVAAFRSGNRQVIRCEFDIAEERLVVGVISKLWEGKGHDLLFRAWKNLLDRQIAGQPLLMVVGAGPLESQLRRLACELGIVQSVLFTGFRSDIPDVTAAIDIAVLPSMFEGMGRVVLEAMAAGKPVVASRVGGIPDLIQDLVNGILVSPNDVSALEAGLAELLARPALRKSLSETASQSLLREYSSAVMVDRIHDFYGIAAAIKTRSSRAISL